mgnify:CR=1 FL=1
MKEGVSLILENDDDFDSIKEITEDRETFPEKIFIIQNEEDDGVKKAYITSNSLTANELKDKFTELGLDAKVEGPTLEEIQKENKKLEQENEKIINEIQKLLINVPDEAVANIEI